METHRRTTLAVKWFGLDGTYIAVFAELQEHVTILSSSLGPCNMRGTKVFAAPVSTIDITVQEDSFTTLQA